jgi:hypothetical protein
MTRYSEYVPFTKNLNYGAYERRKHEASCWIEGISPTIFSTDDDYEYLEDQRQPPLVEDLDG